MVYIVSIVTPEGEVRASGKCFANELDSYVRVVARKMRKGERCVYKRVN